MSSPSPDIYNQLTVGYSDKAIKIHPKKWAFIKNGKTSSSPHQLSPEAKLPSSSPAHSTSIVSYSKGHSTTSISVAKETTTSKAVYPSQPPVIAQSNVYGVGDQQLHIKQARTAILILRSATECHRNLKLFQEGTQNNPSPDREPEHLPSLLDRTCIKLSPYAVFWQWYLGSGDVNELKAVEQYLDTIYLYGEQLESPISER